MPPMTTMAEGMVTARPRNTNFSIAAIMNENKEKEEDIEEEEEEELEVGTETDNLDELSETADETEKIVTSLKRISLFDIFIHFFIHGNIFTSYP